MEEDRVYLIHYLLNEIGRNDVVIPPDCDSQMQLLRSLFNIRKANEPKDPNFLEVQDRFLQAVIASKGITDIDELSPVRDNIYVWQGDITLLKCDAIVNAANSALLGCWHPCHRCIDNAIHTFSGVQLRLACNEIMVKQGHEEPTGDAKITPAFNLPSKYVIHTVGPIVYGVLTDKERMLLRNCYKSCLKIADENGAKSIAFCCISTGEFHFPNDEAAQIAVETVTTYIDETKSDIKVVFNVFKDLDLQIYQSIL